MRTRRDFLRTAASTLAVHAVLALTPVLVAGAAQAGAPAESAAPEDSRLLPYAAPGQLVEIGSRRINLTCSGTGSPTVVLMAGLSSWSPVWYKVQPVIASATRVCAYDRAGYGFSDPAPRPPIVSDVVEDLHAALTAGAVPGPYVLVGHSLGGIEARLYTKRWSHDVAGLVLDDTSPAAEGLIDETQPGFDEAIDREHFTSTLLHCALLTARGPLELGTPDYKECGLRLPSDTPAAFRAVVPRFFGADYFAAKASLLSSIYTHRYDSVDHLRLGTLPLVVLSAEDSWGSGTPESERFSRAYSKRWVGMHRSLARLSSRGVHRFIQGSGHEIQLDKPQAVIAAIDEVIRDVRGAKQAPRR